MLSDRVLYSHDSSVEISKILFRKDAESGQCYLTKDSQVACQLLAINPADLIPRTYASFREKGLDEVRQKLRYEHFEDKRKLKVRAIENVIVTAN